MADGAPTGIRIGELMKRSGVTRATVHHYVREGLLPEPVKTGRNMALYAPDCVDRVLLIKSLQSNYRRSLAEVRELLSGATGHEALERLKARVGTEAATDMDLRTDEVPLTVEQLSARTGFPKEQLDSFAKRGLIQYRGSQAEAAVQDHDVAVVDALARLREAGFGREAGFKPQDAEIYLKALRDLLHKEVQIFLERADPGMGPEHLVDRAERGLQHVTPLLLALRRKLIRELIDTLPLPKR